MLDGDRDPRREENIAAGLVGEFYLNLQPGRLHALLPRRHERGDRAAEVTGDGVAAAPSAAAAAATTAYDATMSSRRPQLLTRDARRS